MQLETKLFLALLMLFLAGTIFGIVVHIGYEKLNGINKCTIAHTVTQPLDQ